MTFDYGFGGLLAALVLFLGGMQVLTAAVWAWHGSGRKIQASATWTEDVTVIMPIAGLPRAESACAVDAARYLAPQAQLIYVARDEEKESARALRKDLADLGLTDDRRIQVMIAGGERSRNPKLDSIAPAVAAAQTDCIICVDGNVMLPPDYVGQICRAWSPDVTALSAAPRTTSEGNLAAFFEGAVINLSHARWLTSLARIGLPFAHGKLLAFRKGWLEAQGGIAALHCKRAEDTALTVLVRQSAGHLRLIDMPVLIPLGERRWHDVLARNFRWRFLRSRDVTLGYLVEPLSTNWPTVMLAAAVDSPAPLLAALATWVVLHLTEAAAWTRATGHWSAMMHAGLLLRDLAEPFMWLAGWWLWRQRAWRVTASASRARPSEGSE